MSELWDQSVLDLRGENVISETIAGFIDDLSNSTKEVNQQGQTLNWYETPFTLEVVSDNAADVQPLQLEYINGDGDRVEALVMLTGTTPVQVPNVLRAELLRNVGGFQIGDNLIPSGGEIQGTVSAYKQGATPNTDGDTFLIITPTINLGAGADAELRGQRSYASHHTIPRGYSGYVRLIQPWTGRNDEVRLSVQAKPFTGVWATEIPMAGVNTISTGESGWRYIPERFDLRVIGQEASGGGTVALLLQYQLMLIKNEAVL